MPLGGSYQGKARPPEAFYHGAGDGTQTFCDATTLEGLKAESPGLLMQSNKRPPLPCTRPGNPPVLSNGASKKMPSLAVRGPFPLIYPADLPFAEIQLCRACWLDPALAVASALALALTFFLTSALTGALASRNS